MIFYVKIDLQNKHFNVPKRTVKNKFVFIFDFKLYLFGIIFALFEWEKLITYHRWKN